MASLLESCADLPRQSFPAGAVLLREGEGSGELYVLVSGSVSIRRRNTEIALVSQPGSLFGEMAILLGRSHTAMVTAASEVEAIYIADGAAFLRSHTEVTYQVAAMLAERLNAATAYLVDLKRQYEGQGEHLGMVGEILEVLIHEQRADFMLGSDREPDPRY